MRGNNWTWPTPPQTPATRKETAMRGNSWT